MDPLSIAASVLAVLTAAGKTAQGLERLVALKDASKDLICVVNEVCTYHCSLKTTLDQNEGIQYADHASSR
jgi:hypothetical protein